MGAVRPRRALLISSGGGHWQELLRIVPAFDGLDVVFATVDRAYESDIPGQRLVVITDATRWNKLALLRLILQIAMLVVRLRPDLVISTGAAPGYLAIRIGKMMGARTIWLDSFANVQELSLSGQMAGAYADLWLTQWPHLATPEGPRFEGAVI